MTRTDKRIPRKRGANVFHRDASGYILIIERQEETYTVRIHFVYLGWSAGYVSHTSRAHGGQRARGGEGIVPAHPV